MIPNWLQKKEKWFPLKGRDKYIDKTLLSITAALSLFRQEHAYSSAFLYKPSASLKLIATLLLIVLLSLSRNLTYILFIDSFDFFCIGLLGAREIRKVLLITLTVLFFFSLILSFSFFSGNQRNTLLLLGKAAGTIMLINILALSTNSRHLTASLRYFFIPDIIVLILDITLKYIVVLGHIAAEMLTAKKIRSLGKDKRADISLSMTMGILYMKSREYANALTSAMECRGFNGEYKKEAKQKFTLWDLMYASVHIFLVSLYFYLVS